MTEEDAGMTEEDAGMTEGNAGMTEGNAGMTEVRLPRLWLAMTVRTVASRNDGRGRILALVKDKNFQRDYDFGLKRNFCRWALVPRKNLLREKS
jgi:hypothetical protein